MNPEIPRGHVRAVQRALGGSRRQALEAGDGLIVAVNFNSTETAVRRDLDGVGLKEARERCGEIEDAPAAAGQAKVVIAAAGLPVGTVEPQRRLDGALVRVHQEETGAVLRVGLEHRED